MSKENELSPEEDAQAQKEIMSALFDAEMGGQSFTPEGSDISPEILETFFNQIREFHAQEGNEITVRDYLGEEAPLPNFKPKSKEEAQTQVEQTVSFLEEKQILLLFPDELSMREKFVFISRNLLDYKILPPVGGQILTISYDDFQDAETALINASVEGFLLSLLNLEHPFSEFLLSSEVRLGSDVVSRERAKEHIDIWRSQFQKIVPIAYDPGQAKRQGSQNSMFFTFMMAYETTNLKGNTKEEQGAGIAQVIYEEGTWCIQGASFPGFEF